jgi:DMSO/TMAO reductase YedYZ molybdopterin-dependent catalytic subunit
MTELGTRKGKRGEPAFMRERGNIMSETASGTKTRRQFLRRILGFLAGIGLLMNPVPSMVRSVFAATRKTILPKGTKRNSLVGKDPKTLDTRNLEPTPLKDFGTMGQTDYEVDLEAWRLEVVGHVKRPLNLKYKEILALPPIERTVLLICPGVFANNGRWRGISIAALLETAEVKEGATHVSLTGPRGGYEMTRRYPMEDILRNKVFLARAVNGQVLPEKHGFPLRAVAEGYFGFDWVKYVYKVTVEKAPS